MHGLFFVKYSIQMSVKEVSYVKDYVSSNK